MEGKGEEESMRGRDILKEKIRKLRRQYKITDKGKGNIDA